MVNEIQTNLIKENERLKHDKELLWRTIEVQKETIHKLWNAYNACIHPED